jgi:hypothetical protein
MEAWTGFFWLREKNSVRHFCWKKGKEIKDFIDIY